MAHFVHRISLFVAHSYYFWLVLLHLFNSFGQAPAQMKAGARLDDPAQARASQVYQVLYQREMYHQMQIFVGLQQFQQIVVINRIFTTVSRGEMRMREKQRLPMYEEGINHRIINQDY